MRKLIITFIINASIIVGACGRGGGALSVTSPDDLRGRLEAASAIGKATMVTSLGDLRARTSSAGLTCDTFPAFNAQELKDVGGATEGGWCDHGSPTRTTLLAVFSRSTSLDSVLSSEASASGGACTRGVKETFGLGVNWMILADDGSTVVTLTKALGGQVRVVKCHDDGSTEPKVTPDSLSRKIDAGIMCADYHAVDAERFVDAEARCTVDGDRTTFLTFKDSGAKSDYLSVANGVIRCVLNQSSTHYLSGSNWVIESDTETTGAALAKALGTNVKTVECAKP